MYANTESELFRMLYGGIKMKNYDAEFFKSYYKKYFEKRAKILGKLDLKKIYEYESENTSLKNCFDILLDKNNWEDCEAFSISTGESQNAEKLEIRKKLKLDKYINVMKGLMSICQSSAAFLDLSKILPTLSNTNYVPMLFQKDGENYKISVNGRRHPETVTKEEAEKKYNDNNNDLTKVSVCYVTCLTGNYKQVKASYQIVKEMSEKKDSIISKDSAKLIAYFYSLRVIFQKIIKGVMLDDKFFKSFPVYVEKEFNNCLGLVGYNLDNYNWIEKSSVFMQKMYEWCEIEEPSAGAMRAIHDMLWELKGYHDVLNDATPNVIFYGSPGTGKTFYVQKMVEALTYGEMDCFELIQCHPGYGYEEFMEGIKPVGISEDGKLKLDVVTGAFKKLCIKAMKNLRDAEDDNEIKTYYFVADEINRANLSEMFGETLSLLEASYRWSGEDDNKRMIVTPLTKMIESNAIALGDRDKAEKYLQEQAVWYEIDEQQEPYSVKVRFVIPKNVRLIGMMNDVDKSIDSFDLALRRRFRWIAKSCDYTVIEESFCGTELSAYDVNEYVKRCTKLNEYISTRKVADNIEGLGLGKAYEFGHSYFMQDKVEICKDNVPATINYQKLFDEHLKLVLKEYLRSQCDEKEIDDKLMSAGKIFVGENYKSTTNDNVDMEKVLQKSKNIILYGAPGTGKTFIVSEYLGKKYPDAHEYDEHVTWVQCHPGFGYEEFMEGIKPTGMADGNIKFEILNGAFKNLCIKAKRNPTDDYYYVADEINRANLSAMFGEMLSKLEETYRYNDKDEQKKNLLNMVETPLAGVIKKYIEVKPELKEELAFACNTDGDVKFGVPNNVYFIGMMNDVDRSIDSFDLALRRRFDWVRVGYSEEKLSKLVEGLGNSKVFVEACTKLNDVIARELGQTYQFGHAIFMHIKDYAEPNGGKINNPQFSQLFDEHLAPTLKEYYRSFLEDDEIIGKKVTELKENFKK